MCGVSFLFVGRWSGSSVADVRYRIGVDIFSCGLVQQQQWAGIDRKELVKDVSFWLLWLLFFCQFWPLLVVNIVFGTYLEHA